MNVIRHFEVLLTYYSCFNCSELIKKTHRLEIKRKMASEAWEHKKWDW